MSGFDAVASNVTANSMSTLNDATTGVSLLGCAAVIVFIIVILSAPKLVRRLILGYITLALCGMVLVVLHALLLSLEPISNWLWYGVFAWIGNIIIKYWLYILISLPIAWLAGGSLDRELCEDKPKEKVSKKQKRR